jgi:hypothetical protein
MIRNIFKRKSPLEKQLDSFIKIMSIEKIHKLQEKYEQLLANFMDSENYYCGILNFLDTAEKMKNGMTFNEAWG